MRNLKELGLSRVKVSMAARGRQCPPSLSDSQNPPGLSKQKNRLGEKPGGSMGECVNLKYSLIEHTILLYIL
jgi:hypothetical protein